MPFDVQTCTLKLYLPHTQLSVVKLVWSEIVANEITNAEWLIEHPSDWQRSELIRSISSPFGDVRVSVIQAEFNLKRRPNFLLKNFMYQVASFYLLSWVGLWIDVSAVPARAAIGIIPVLVTSNKLSAFAAIIPPISYLTRMEMFMDVTLVMITLHMIEFGMVHFAGRQYKKIVRDTTQVQAWEGDADKVLPYAAIDELPRHAKAYVAAIIFIHLSLDKHMRWVSPAAYVLAIAIILA